MMQKINFKYTRRKLLHLLLIPVLVLLILLVIGMGYIGIGPAPILIVFGIFSLTAVVILVLITEAKGYFILHEKHVEISLGGKVRDVEYSRIESVSYEYKRWLAKVDGEPNIYISLSLSTTSNKAIEHLMETLLRNIKNTGALKKDRDITYDFRYKNYWLSFLIAVLLTMAFLPLFDWLETFIRHWHEAILLIIFFGGLAAIFILPYLLLTFNGVGILHKSHVEIQLWKTRHEVDYNRIKEVYRSFGHRGPDHWVIRIDGSRNISMAIIARARDDKHIGHFMEALQEKVPQSH